MLVSLLDTVFTFRCKGDLIMLKSVKAVFRTKPWKQDHYLSWNKIFYICLKCSYCKGADNFGAPIIDLYHEFVQPLHDLTVSFSYSFLIITLLVLEYKIDKNHVDEFFPVHINRYIALAPVRLEGMLGLMHCRKTIHFRFQHDWFLRYNLSWALC